MVNIIVAVNKKGFIGKDNKLLWHNKEDLQLFKNITLNQTIVMGRKTWESISNNPLKNRYSIIISKTADIKGDTYHSVDTFDPQAMADSKEVYWVIGGEQIYKEFLPYARFVYISYIKNEDEGDSRFDLPEGFECKIIRHCKTFKQKIYENKGR